MSHFWPVSLRNAFLKARISTGYHFLFFKIYLVYKTQEYSQGSSTTSKLKTAIHDFLRNFLCFYKTLYFFYILSFLQLKSLSPRNWNKRVKKTELGYELWLRAVWPRSKKSVLRGWSESGAPKYNGVMCDRRHNIMHAKFLFNAPSVNYIQSELYCNTTPSWNSYRISCDN